MRFLLLLTIAISSSALADASIQFFGETMPSKPEAISIKDAIESFDDQVEPMKISGTITKVCQKKGCFMVLAEGDTYARVRFKDYGFFVPKDSATSDAVVFGVLSAKNLSPKQANHYAEDEGSDQRYPDGKREFAIMASSVEIYSSVN